jgi:hypothetical protein
MANTSISSDLPLLPETWLQILTYLWRADDIKSACLTCQSLRQMAQPHLFRYLTVRPYSDDQIPLATQGIGQRSLQKLTFCSSNQLIAPGVRRLEIVPVQAEGPFGNLVLDDIFRQLPKFVNLVTIVCYNILCTNQHLIEVSKLWRLRMIAFTDCHFEIPTDCSATLTVSSLTINSQSPFYSLINDWFSHFRPDSIHIRDPHTSILPGLVTFPSAIQYLQALSMSIHRETLHLLVKVLSHRPPLRSLRLAAVEMTKDDLRMFRFTPSPLLRDFKGPCELLCALSTTELLQKLRVVELPSLSTNRHDDPEDVKQAVMSLGESAKGLEMLQFSVTHLTEDLLNTVVCLCNKLQTLRISAVDQNVNSPANPDAYTVEVRLPAICHYHDTNL